METLVCGGGGGRLVPVVPFVNRNGTTFKYFLVELCSTCYDRQFGNLNVCYNIIISTLILKRMASKSYKIL